MSTQATVNSFFAPTQISGCQLWLDAADVNTLTFTSPTTISNWKDKAVGNNATANIPITYNLNGLGSRYPALTFTSSQWLNGPVSITGTTMTVFSVFSMNSSSPFAARIIALAATETNDFNNIGYVGILRQSSTNIGPYRNGTYTQTTTPYSTPLINTTYFDGTTQNTATNGGTVSSTTLGGTFAVSAYRVANNTNTADTAAGALNGFIGEILIYNASLTTAQRQQVEGYLAWKWGLQANLPATHPYKSSPIPPLLNPPSTRPLIQGNTFFAPTQISGCQLWLDGADPNGNRVLPRNNTLLPTWVDKSGNGRNATAYSTAATFLNSNVVFTGSQMYNTSLSSVLNQQTIFAIASANSINKMDITGVQTSAVTTGIQLIVQTYSQVVTLFGGTLVANGAAVSQNVSFIYGNVYNAGSDSFVYLNGSQTGTKASSTTLTGSGTITLGAYFYIGSDPTPSEWWIGTISEVLIYNAVLTTAQRQQVEGYLAWKWGLQANLPTGHPYKTSLLPPLLNPPQITARVSSAAWQPTQLSGLQLWLDAADRSSLILSGTTVTQWNDKSGNSRNATQSTASLQPTYLTKSVRFNSSASSYNSMNITTLTASSNIESAFIVLAPLGGFGSGSTAAILSSSTFGGRELRYSYASPQLLQSVKSYIADILSTTLNTYTNGTTTLYQYINNGSTITHYQSGSALGSGTSLSYTAGLTTVIGTNPYFNPLAEPLYAEVNEVLIYSTALTSTQRQTVEGYLAWKWGLVASLPANHPFKRWPPAP